MQVPGLPQHDADPEARAHALAEARARHVYDRDVFPPLPLCHELPADERPRRESVAGRLAVPINRLAVALRTLVDRFDHLQDYEDLFSLRARPAIVERWRSDHAFAEQRLSGVEPRVLRRVEHLPDNLRLDADEFAAIAGVSLAEAEAEGRLFLADYDLLDGLPAAGAQGGSRFVYAPLALFTWQPDLDADERAPPPRRGRLVPVAIQLDQRPSRTNLYTPRDGLDWLLARTVVQSADVTVATFAHHLARVRLGMAGFAMATARQLAEPHPLARLLRPHQRAVLAGAELAQRLFFAEDGWVDACFGPTRDGARELVRRGHERWRVDDFGFVRDLELRGLAGEQLPHYPWRDDGHLVWDALHEFVGGYLQWAYPDDRDLHEDHELQAWVGELGDPAGAGLRGLPRELGRASLVQLVADIIFAAGPCHSAFITAQAEYASFVPNLPMALYSPMPGVRGDVDESYLLHMLPPQAASLRQLECVARLGAAHDDPFGHYTLDDGLHQPAVVHDLVVTFQERLVTAEQKIEHRNRERPIPYHGLLPSRIGTSA